MTKKTLIKKAPTKKEPSTMIGKFVIVRTYSAGVHCGVLASQDGATVRLTNARRIWRWAGANTLNELSQRGAAEGSRISEPVPEIEIDRIELIPCTKMARENLERSRWN